MTRPRILAFGRMKESDFLVRRYTVMIPIDHTLKDVESPGYFNHHITQLAKIRAFGPVRLEVISDDCSTHAEYMVLEATKGGVRVRREAVYHDGSDPAEEPDERTVMEAGAQDMDIYTMKFAGPAKHRIFEHGNLVAEKIQSKVAAQEMTDELNSGDLLVGDIPQEYEPKQVGL